MPIRHYRQITQVQKPEKISLDAVPTLTLPFLTVGSTRSVMPAHLPKEDAACQTFRNPWCPMLSLIAELPEEEVLDDVMLKTPQSESI